MSTRRDISVRLRLPQLAQVLYALEARREGLIRDADPTQRRALRSTRSSLERCRRAFLELRDRL